MTLSATVLIPTHNHGPTLRYAAQSALAQNIRDLEVFIVGDGMTEETKRVAVEIQCSDARVRLFDHPKGPRHGEIYRDAALREARGRIVCYLSDDDLWLPLHVETMVALLANALRDEIRRDDHGRVAGALAVPCLQHEQLLVLDRELKVLDVFVVALEPARNVPQLLVCLGHDFP